MRLSFLTIILCIISFQLLSQDVKLVHRATASSIELKWYSQQLTYPNGVNIFRQQLPNESWEKINNTPLKKGLLPTQNEIDADENLKIALDIANQENSFDGIILLNMIVTSFSNTAFANYLGIYYKDKDVAANTSYIYKLTDIENNEIARSQPITPSLVVLSPPKEIKTEFKKHKVGITWKPEDIRYYGVNIYRSSQVDSLTKINPFPIMISKVKNGKGESVYPNIFFEDNDIKEDMNYSYQLSCIDFFGTESGLSDKFLVEVGDTTPPLPVLNIKIFNTKDNVPVLGWQQVSDPSISAIRIYHSSKLHKNKKLVATLSKSDTTYIDSSATAGEHYYYITNVDASGNESLVSPVFIHIEDMVGPNTPVNFSAIADTGKIHLSWDSVNNVDLKGYRVLRSVTKNDIKQFINIHRGVIPQNRFTDILPKEAGNTFYYYVVAEDSSYNKSKPSDIIGIKMPDVTPPIKPFIKNISQDSTGLIIEWLANTDPDLLGYNIHRINGEHEIKLNNEPITSTIYIDNTVLPNTEYKYYLTAYDSTMNQSSSSDSFSAKFISTNTIITLAAPSVKVKRKKHVITWKNTNNNIKGVIVYMSEKQGALKPRSPLTTERSYTVKNISKDVTYTYEIRTYDDSGLIGRSKPIIIN